MKLYFYVLNCFAATPHIELSIRDAKECPSLYKDFLIPPHFYRRTVKKYEIGVVIDGTDLVLDCRDDNYAEKALKAHYKWKIRDEQNTIEGYEKMVSACDEAIQLTD